MAWTAYFRDVTGNGTQIALIVADTAAELPTTGFAAGTLGYAADTQTHYFLYWTGFALAWLKRVRTNVFAIQVAAANAATLTDAQTIYFGSRPSVAPGTTAAVSRLYIPRAGSIVAATIYGRAGTAGTNESWTLSIRLNNTSDTTIQALASNSQDRVWSNTSLAIAVAAGDYIEIKSVNPTWATNPANLVWSGTIILEASL